MDEEDLADAAAAQDIRTTDPFAVLGASGSRGHEDSVLAGLIRTQGDTAGLKLLRKMGWKDGQGVGPKVRRKARLGVSVSGQHAAAEAAHLFAPDDVEMITFTRKADRKGLGYEGENGLAKLSRLGSSRENTCGSAGDEEDVGDYADDLAGGLRLSFGVPGKKQTETRKHGQRSGFGVGILNDTGSDNEDPYEMGPRISYNRVIGGERTKKKKKMASTSISANPTLKSKPVFISKSASTKGRDQRRCLDGKPPLKGFAIAQSADARLSGQPATLFLPPAVPSGWVPTKRDTSINKPTAYTSTTDAAKAAQHDPTSRATILGETILPGKSVFDYMSAATRERLAVATGNKNLPPARGEIPPEYTRAGDESLDDRLSGLPVLAKETAIAAMSRGAGAGGPYANDEAKNARYKLYLQTAAGFGGLSSTKPRGMTNEDFIKEVEEFYSCAQLFKPMSGFMATRFTTASTGPTASSGFGEALGTIPQQTLHSYKSADPAEEAAKMGMYGSMTRLTEDFSPTKLLCKRFNVQPPAHAQLVSESGLLSSETHSPANQPRAGPETGTDFELLTFGVETKAPNVSSGSLATLEQLSGLRVNELKSEKTVSITEVTRPSDEVFKAVFGDSSDEE
ncbi:G patch domain-containing protein 1 [Colletotrichum chlorophyti]|uniref:G patch domain-containing protein 1 n=1 Tax=Colletotrichum chlorophyti TaxID=708187 RepID=A0A1Q8S3J2_9PEZI|nr:G patch domain-containing protein 1 [Colletotrichum chlorophyti]